MRCCGDLGLTVLLLGNRSREELICWPFDVDHPKPQGGDIVKPGATFVPGKQSNVHTEAPWGRPRYKDINFRHAAFFRRNMMNGLAEFHRHLRESPIGSVESVAPDGA